MTKLIITLVLLLAFVTTTVAVDCGTNEYVADGTSGLVNAGTCVPCPPGTASDAGTDTPASACTAIVCVDGQHVVNNECVDCTNGVVNPAGDVATGGAACPLDWSLTPEVTESCSGSDFCDTVDLTGAHGITAVDACESGEIHTPMTGTIMAAGINTCAGNACLPLDTGDTAWILPQRLSTSGHDNVVVRQGEQYRMSLRSDGSVWMLGSIQNTATITVPYQHEEMTEVTSLVGQGVQDVWATPLNAFVRTSDDRTMGFGSNFDGSLGLLGSTSPQNDPVNLPAWNVDGPIVMMVGGYYPQQSRYTLALTSGGKVLGAGAASYVGMSNWNDQVTEITSLGSNNVFISASKSGFGVVQEEPGGGRTCKVIGDACDGYCLMDVFPQDRWGEDGFISVDELGADVQEIHVSRYGVMALKVTGAIWGWGWMGTAFLGNGGQSADLPQELPVWGTDNAGIGLGAAFSGVVKTDGTFWTAGTIPNLGSSATPTKQDGFGSNNIMVVANGGDDSIMTLNAVDADGTPSLIAIEAARITAATNAQDCTYTPYSPVSAAAPTSCADTECNTLCGENHGVTSHVCVPCAAGTTASGADTSGDDVPCVPTICGIDQHVTGSHTCADCVGSTANAPGDDASGDATTCNARPCKDGYDDHMSCRDVFHDTGALRNSKNYAMFLNEMDGKLCPSSGASSACPDWEPQEIPKVFKGQTEEIGSGFTCVKSNAPGMRYTCSKG